MGSLQIQIQSGLMTSLLIKSDISKTLTNLVSLSIEINTFKKIPYLPNIHTLKLVPHKPFVKNEKPLSIWVNGAFPNLETFVTYYNEEIFKCKWDHLKVLGVFGIVQCRGTLKVSKIIVETLDSTPVLSNELRKYFEEGFDK